MAKNTRRPAAPRAANSSPAAPAPADAVADPNYAGRTVTLAAGETFDELAARVGADRDALFAANRDVLGSNTDRIPAGTSLTVPTE